jgi:predicted nuclease with TOPRIM domain
MEWIMPQYPLDIDIEKVQKSRNIANFAAFMSFPNSLPRNQSRRNEVRKRTKFCLQDNQERLQAEITALKQELAILNQEKAELENLLKTQKQVRKLQVQEIQIEIDLNKLASQVSEITQADYFQKLQVEVEYLRNVDC